MNVFLLTGCASFPRMSTFYNKSATYSPSTHAAPSVNEKRKVGKPYKIMGKWYYPVSSSEGYSEKGIASWYGDEFHGKPTANGEVYNMHAFTAAHTTLPLPTYVRVTNLENGRHIKVKVNDRGPFLRGRLIDMSYAGATALGFAEQGTAPVLVEAYPTDGSPLRTPQTQFAEVQKQPVSAQLKAQKPKKTSGSGFTYRISEKTHEAEAPQQTTQTMAKAHIPIYVQTGAFSESGNAERQKKAIAGLYNNVKVVQSVVNGKSFNRVRVGPLVSVDIADQVLARLINEGYKESIIVID